MNSRTKTLLLLAALIVLVIGSILVYNRLVLGAGDAQGSQPATTPPEERIAAPDFNVIDAESNPVSLADLSGKPMVINFWASWCPYCKVEMPDFQAAYDTYGDELQFVMMNATDNIRETFEKGQTYIENSGYTFPVYYDTLQEAVGAYGVTSFPSTIFVDQDGYVVKAVVGKMTASALEKGIEAILPSE